MRIPKLLENEIQLFVHDDGAFLYIALTHGMMVSIEIIGDSFDEKFSINEDTEIELDPNSQSIVSINPKYKNNLISKDITIRNMTIDIIINENKDFINKYLKKKYD